jgi:hypothetical protein
MAEVLPPGKGELDPIVHRTTYRAVTNHASPLTLVQSTANSSYCNRATVSDQSYTVKIQCCWLKFLLKPLQIKRSKPIPILLSNPHRRILLQEHGIGKVHSGCSAPAWSVHCIVHTVHCAVVHTGTLTQNLYFWDFCIGRCCIANESPVLATLAK